MSLFQERQVRFGNLGFTMGSNCGASVIGSTSYFFSPRNSNSRSKKPGSLSKKEVSIKTSLHPYVTYPEVSSTLSFYLILAAIRFRSCGRLEWIFSAARRCIGCSSSSKLDSCASWSISGQIQGYTLPFGAFIRSSYFSSCQTFPG